MLTSLCEISLGHDNVVTVLVIDLLVLVVGLLLAVSRQLRGGERRRYIRNYLDVDILGLDDRVGGRLVQAEGVVVVEVAALRLLGLVLGGGTCALPLLADGGGLERRDVVGGAGLGAKRGGGGGIQGRGGAVGADGVVGRVVVGRLGGRVRRVLVVDGVVGGGGGRGLALLVGMAGRLGGGGALQGGRARGGGLVVVVVDDNDLLGQAVLVEVGPVGVAAAVVAGGGRGGGHVGGGGRLQGRQLLGVSAEGARGAARVWARVGGAAGAAGVAGVHGIAYARGAGGERGGIGQAGRVGLVCLVVGIELMMGRERGRGRRGRRHGGGAGRAGDGTFCARRAAVTGCGRVSGAAQAARGLRRWGVAGSGRRQSQTARGGRRPVVRSSGRRGPQTGRGGAGRGRRRTQQGSLAQGALLSSQMPEARAEGTSGSSVAAEAGRRGFHTLRKVINQTAGSVRSWLRPRHSSPRSREPRRTRAVEVLQFWNCHALQCQLHCCVNTI